jgi:RNA polymerase sigma factor (TIGR02999 family)
MSGNRSGELPPLEKEAMSANLDVTQLLVAWAAGERAALDALIPLVMDELKRIAGAYLAREAHAQTLQTTALVNEAYLRLVSVRSDSWESRIQFFALAAQIMRRILVDHARAQLGPKRGGGMRHLPLDGSLPVSADVTPRLVGLDDALTSLEKLDPRKGRIVELRIFGGLSNTEIAEVLHVSERTVMRDWQFAKAWLGRELDHDREGR